MNSEKNMKESKLYVYLDKSAPVLIGTFLFFNPIPHTTAIKEICFYISCVFVLVLVLLRKREFIIKTPLSIPFGFFVLWVFIGLFFALDVENSIHDFFTHLLKHIALYFIIINFFNSRKKLVWLAGVLSLSVVIFCIGGLYYQYVLIGETIYARFGFSFNEYGINRIGIMSIFAILLLLHHAFTYDSIYKKTICAVNLVPLFTATLLTQARSTIVALFISVTILLVREKSIKKIAFFIIIMAIIFTTFVGKRFYNGRAGINLRIYQYFISYEVAKDFPLTGIGFGGNTYVNKIDQEQYKKKFWFYEKATLRHPHSMYSDVLLRTGFIGFALFVFIIVTAFRTCWMLIKRGENDFIRNWGWCMLSACIMIFLIGFCEPFSLYFIEVILYTIFAMITVVWRLNEEIRTQV